MVRFGIVVEWLIGLSKLIKLGGLWLERLYGFEEFDVRGSTLGRLGPGGFISGRSSIGPGRG